MATVNIVGNFLLDKHNPKQRKLTRSDVTSDPKHITNTISRLAKLFILALRNLPSSDVTKSRLFVRFWCLSVEWLPSLRNSSSSSRSPSPTDPLLPVIAFAKSPSVRQCHKPERLRKLWVRCLGLAWDGWLRALSERLPLSARWLHSNHQRSGVSLARFAILLSSRNLITVNFQKRFQSARRSTDIGIREGSGRHLVAHLQ